MPLELHPMTLVLEVGPFSDEHRPVGLLVYDPDHAVLPAFGVPHTNELLTIYRLLAVDSFGRKWQIRVERLPTVL